jgi:hypothetical protein
LCILVGSRRDLAAIGLLRPLLEREFMIRLLSSIANFVGNTWCKFMHPDPMWPVRGENQCRVCHRRFPVAWEKAAVRPEAAAVAPSKREPISAATVSQNSVA